MGSGGPQSAIRRRASACAALGVIGVSLLSTVAGPRPAANASTISPTPVVVIVMENKSYQTLLANPNAPFINKTLMAGGRVDTHYVAAIGSLPDYLVIVSGARAPAKTAPNLFTRLGTTTPWTEYMESAPSVCYQGAASGVVPGTTEPLYTRYHNPAMQFTTVSATALCNHVLPLDASHFNPTTLPRFSFIVPNQCNDMETKPTTNSCPMWNGTTNVAPNTVKMGDNWLASIVPQLAANATVIVTWDEGAPSNEQILTVAYGKGVTAAKDATAYTHSSLEAGLYAYLGLGTVPGTGAGATPLSIP